jgi:hypothetical protein
MWELYISCRLGFRNFEKNTHTLQTTWFKKIVMYPSVQKWCKYSSLKKIKIIKTSDSRPLWSNHPKWPERVAETLQKLKNNSAMVFV